MIDLAAPARRTDTRALARVALAAVPAAALLVALVSHGTPLVARLVIVVVSGVTFWDPAAGLLCAAGFAPLGGFIAALDGMGDFRLTEVILVSFIAAWLVRLPSREADRGPRLPRYAWGAAWLFSVLILSLAAAIGRQLLRHPDALRTDLTTVALHYFGYADPTGFADCARILEGFAIVGAVLGIFRRRPSLARSLPVALALSALAAAAASVLLSFGIGPQRVLAREAVLGYRFAAHVVDVNAAGSHFAMVLCLALGMVLRERGRRRTFWIVSAGACALGLWMSHSRSAEAAAGLVIPSAFLWAKTATWPRARRAAVIGSVLGVLIVFGIVRAWQIERDPTYTASGFRQQFVMSSFRVIGTHPYLGIGVGRYYRDSPNFLTPQLAWSYGSENAHNNFLEITTEAGIIGFFVYAAFFVGAFGLAFVALARDPHDWRLLGATAGLVAFLGTCLMGHPLLVPEVAAAFFTQLALAAALGGSSLLNDAESSGRLQPATEGSRERPANIGRYEAIVAVGTIAFAVLPIWLNERPLVPVHLEEVDGMYYDGGGIAEGVPYRWTRQYASLFPDADWRVIEIPLRAPSSGLIGDQIVVDITSSGRQIARAIVGPAWSSVVLTLPSPEPPLLKNRVNLFVNHTARVSDFTPGSTDNRVVGIQVGDIRILRVAWDFVPKPGGTPPE